MGLQDNQDKLEKKLGGEPAPEVASEEITALKSDLDAASQRFNKKVDIKSKLRSLGVAVILGATPLLAEAHTQTKTQQTASVTTEHDYQYYEDKNFTGDFAYQHQKYLAFDLNKKMEQGELGYSEAKTASAHILEYPEGVIDFYRAGQQEREDEILLDIISEKLKEGVDFNAVGQVAPKRIIPLTEELRDRLEKAEERSVKLSRHRVERGVTQNLLKAIDLDDSLTPEAKDSLMMVEVKDYMTRVDSGRYDTAEDSKYIQRNKDRFKKDMLKYLSEINPPLAEKIAKQQTAAQTNSQQLFVDNGVQM